MDSKDFLKLLQGLGQKQLDSLAANIFAAFGIGADDIKKMQTEKAIDAQRSAAPKPDKFKAGGQTEAFSKSGKIRDYRDPRTSANKAPTTSPTPSGPKPQATPPRGFRDTAPAGQLTTSGAAKPARPGSPAQLGSSRAKLLPSAGQSGGSKPPKGTKAPVRGGSNLSPADARRASAASRAAASSVRPSATSSSATPMPGAKGPSGLAKSLGRNFRPGRATLATLGLGLANYLQDAILTDEQLAYKAENELKPLSLEEDFGYIFDNPTLKRILTNLGKSREERLNPKPTAKPPGFAVEGSLMPESKPEPVAAATPVAPTLPPKNPNQQAPVTADPGRRIRPFPNLGIEQVQPYRSSMQMR